jgi:valyl-tRNA synthetase
VGLYLEGILDVHAELNRLNNEITETTSNLERIQALLSKDTFISNAPAEVVEKERQRGSGLEAKLSSLKEVVNQLQEY